jgi:two-component sensor histidine kinase
VERLNNVMTAVLDLSQLETQTLALTLEEISVVGPLERALAALEYLAQEKGVEVKRQLQGRYPRILADDPDRLRQVVYNLVHNAIKFTSEEGIVRVSLEAVPRANLGERLPSDGTVKLPEYSGKQSLLFTVADDGEGIPTTFIRSIFNKFSQGPSAGPNTRGSGLGLAIVKALVEAHGGAVWVESEPGEGSRFQVVLPELSRKEHLVRTTEATVERAKTTFAPLTLVILKVVPIIRGAVSDTHQRAEMNNLLQKVVETTRNTVRLKGDRVEILDPSLGILSLLAAISPEDVPALLRRVTSTLKQQTKEKGQSLNLQLVWGMASYPKDVSTAAELIAAALKAIAGAGAEVINLGQR